MSFLFAVMLLLLPLQASAADIYFDIAARKTTLQQPEYAAIREACLAENIKLPKSLPEPIDTLYAKKSYGNDNRMEPFTLFAMVMGGRALAGDTKAAQELHDALLQWAKADALLQTEALDKTWYPLQRYMIPLIINFAIIAEDMPASDRETIETWMGKMMHKLNKRFGGDVDHNNHRYLADSAAMVWGAYADESELYQVGMEGFRFALREALASGEMPYESRRGSRAVWYLRHALTSLTLMAEIARQQGDDLYSVSENQVQLDTIVNYFMNSIYAPLFIYPGAAENLKPGTPNSYFAMDSGFLKTRGARHYMAFAEAYILRDSFAANRLGALMRGEVTSQRPLLDDYFGGNATCFFAEPKEYK